MAAGKSNANIIADEYAKLSMDDEDIDGLILEGPLEDSSTTDFSLCLVGSFQTNRKINFMAMQDTLASMWRPVKGVFMEETNVPNLIIFKFFHELDLQRVLSDGPWTFNNQVLMLKKMEEGVQLSEIKLSEIYIWMQVYDLPIGFNSEFILKSIGNHVGKFIDSDPNNVQGI